MQTLRCIALSLTLLAASAAALGQADSTEPDPLYQVEIVLFVYEAGSRAEEDFFHGRDDVRHEPAPRRLRLPSLALESVLDRRSPPFGDARPPDSADAAAGGAPGSDAADAADSEFTAGGSPAGAPGDSASGDRLRLFERGADGAEGDTVPGAPRSPRRVPAASPPVPDGFRLLPAEALELTAASRQLENDGRYTVLGHTGWIQAGVDSDRSVALDLAHLGITNPAGTIEVYLRRFLHVAADLTWHDGDGSFWQALPGAGLAPLDYARHYRLVDERNAMRSGELHYIDHPLFGVLVLINPVPEPEADATIGPAG